jgi:hypothetical protein
LISSVPSFFEFCVVQRRRFKNYLLGQDLERGDRSGTYLFERDRLSIAWFITCSVEFVSFEIFGLDIWWYGYDCEGETGERKEGVEKLHFDVC